MVEADRRQRSCTSAAGCSARASPAACTTSRHLQIPKTRNISSALARWSSRSVGIRRSVRTGAETGPSAESAARPQMAVHHTCPHKLQEQIQRVLEFVVHTRLPEGTVHCPCQGRVGVRVQEEPIRHDRLVSTLCDSLCLWDATAPPPGKLVMNATHPRSSRNRQMTFATISSFFSSTPEPPCETLILVRCASFSDAVAPRQREKSIVDDCAYTAAPQNAERQLGSAVSPGLGRGMTRQETLTFCLLSSSSTMAYGTFQLATRSASCVVCGELWEMGFCCAGCSNQKRPTTFFVCQNGCITLEMSASEVARGPVWPSVITSRTNRLYSVVSPLSSGGFSII
ncbi:hypothetical protein OH76DRAFT_1069975 [Lentinus brumalis]|uniref:Uncharacterized protein n=1 Tax=Lentinus brumalis TaxID=2498619 RepID=A0A371DNR1_9APHY|nr:hypothetical protein OH76DRAFT_1069975 [Polyporus brumalis]